MSICIVPIALDLVILLVIVLKRSRRRRRWRNWKCSCWATIWFVLQIALYKHHTTRF